MKAKSFLLIAVAGGCGLVAMLGVQQVMSRPTEPKQAEQKTDEIQVLVATQDIEPFSLLDDSNTKLVKMPAKTVPDPQNVARSREDVADKRLKYGAVKGEYIFLSRLVDKNYSPSDEIPPGMRVVTVKVNQTKAHSGLLRPGDRVDVVLTYKTYKSGRQPVQRSVTILQNVQVFATDNIRRTTVKDEAGNEITVKNTSLLVSPSDANLLMLAESRGQLTLALRQHGDDSEAEIRPYSDDVFDRIASGRATEDSPDDPTQKRPSSLGRFLQHLNGSQNRQKKADNGEDSQKSDEVEMVRPKWRLTIFEGNSPRVEEVEDPNAPLVPVRRVKSADDEDDEGNDEDDESDDESSAEGENDESIGG